MTLVYLSLTASDIKPREGELAARLRVPREAIPPETKLLVERLSGASAPAAVLAYGERTPRLTALLSLDAVPSLCRERLALFAVTLGYGVDRLLDAEKRRGVASAFLLDAVASAMAEAAADAADAALRRLCPSDVFGHRYSPGYGALPLSVNAPLLSLTDAERRLGIRLSESALMHPTKSITAILGGSHENRPN